MHIKLCKYIKAIKCTKICARVYLGPLRLSEPLMTYVIRNNRAMSPPNLLTPVTYLVTIGLHDTEIQTQRFKKTI